MVDTNRLYSVRRADRIIALDRIMKDSIQAKGIRGEKSWSYRLDRTMTASGSIQRAGKSSGPPISCTHGDAKRKNLSE
jgi:hypothetical protein